VKPGLNSSEKRRIKTAPKSFYAMSLDIHLHTMYVMGEYAMHYRFSLQKKDSKATEMVESYLKNVSFKTERKLGIT
jgi:hypothetical protein